VAGRQRDAELLQVVGQALRGVGHLGGLVAGAVQADDQAETGQLVAAHTLDGGHFLDAGGLASAEASSSTPASSSRLGPGGGGKGVGMMCIRFTPHGIRFWGTLERQKA
jgi:hypothetical protein